MPSQRNWAGSGDGCMQATEAPFINAIYDREPLKQWVFGSIVLVGEAAHPTTPHALRSTNMAICDAGAIQCALSEAHHLCTYQKISILAWQPRGAMFGGSLGGLSSRALPLLKPIFCTGLQQLLSVLCCGLYTCRLEDHSLA